MEDAPVPVDDPEALCGELGLREKIPFTTRELASLQGLIFKKCRYPREMSMWSTILPAAAILLAQVQPDLAERWCFERGQQGAKLCEPTENKCNALLEINPEIATRPCLKIEPNLEQSGSTLPPPTSKSKKLTQTVGKHVNSHTARVSTAGRSLAHAGRSVANAGTRRHKSAACAMPRNSWPNGGSTSPMKPDKAAPGPA
jgi:hypothetical protein